MAMTSTDRIRKQVVLRAPRGRVWQALTDARQLGSWFGVAFDDGVQFKPGTRVRGRVTQPGYEHLMFDVSVDRMDPERMVAWRWHPLPIDTTRDYSSEPSTLVTFELETVADGTRLILTESGFD